MLMKSNRCYATQIGRLVMTVGWAIGMGSSTVGGCLL